jgi:hypothetical protein
MLRRDPGDDFVGIYVDNTCGFLCGKLGPTIAVGEKKSGCGFD